MRMYGDGDPTGRHVEAVLYGDRRDGDPTGKAE